jgi:hypothetical protein
MGGFNPKNLNDVEVNEEYQVNNSNWFATLNNKDDDDDDDVDISRAFVHVVTARHQCTRLAYHVALYFNNSMSTTVVFLDIEKAFDPTWHSGLLYKLLNFIFRLA